MYKISVKSGDIISSERFSNKLKALERYALLVLSDETPNFLFSMPRLSIRLSEREGTKWRVIKDDGR